MSAGTTSEDPPLQRTLAGSFSFEGTGLHSGQPARTMVGPAGPDTGIVFHRMDLSDVRPIPADVDIVSGVAWETVLGGDGASVRTVEHLLAAVAVHGIDNVEVRIEGPEPPALDGSAALWCEAISKVGTVEQQAPARQIVVREPFTVVEGDAHYTVAPYAGFRVTAGIDFEHPSIGRQYASAEVECGTFCEQVAPARTFGLASWAESLHARGLALGANGENTIVLTDTGLADGASLRFSDEFVRHKILDAIGDLALAGAPIIGRYVGVKSGHGMTNRLLRALMARPNAWRFESAETPVVPLVARDRRREYTTQVA